MHVKGWTTSRSNDDGKLALCCTRPVISSQDTQCSRILQTNSQGLPGLNEVIYHICASVRAEDSFERLLSVAIRVRILMTRNK